jgi:predicted MFS family arabinose efflux permease
MNRDFYRYFSAEVTSVFGSAFSVTAIGIVGVTVFGATPAELGVVSAAAALPACMLGPAAGVLGDRLRHPRRTLIVCDGVAGCAVLAVAAGIWRDAATIWWLAGLCFVLGCIAALVETIYFTQLRGLVGPDDLTQARAKLQAGEYAGTTAGQAVTGALVAAVGGAAAFLVDAISYMISMALLAGISAPDHGAGPPSPAEGDAVDSTDPREHGFLAAALAGFAESLHHPFLRAFIGFATVRSLVIGAMAALTAPFLLRTLHLPVGVYGVLFAVTGLAGLAGSVLAARLARRSGPQLLTVAGGCGIVVSSLLLPLAGGPVPVAAGLAVLGLGLPVAFGAVANIGLNSIVTDCVPENMLGRVIGNLRSLCTGAEVLGALSGGALGGLLGLRPAMWLCAAVGLAGGLFLMSLIPALRAGPGANATGPTESAKPSAPVAPAPVAPAPVSLPSSR